ncbi:hypothetical protein [Maribacter sp. ACAM166]|uniref:hypothetical protein n=1 Tax=Maribacter sp. ACAM166 TaxID=2508996 RepID=UPI0010FD2BF8|nr:hypothetical protein [Maribacter sp. ACAM166]TLP81448.1 hypothetical protein ES765_05425 [Maribacter sp. ACAM166]
MKSKIGVLFLFVCTLFQFVVAQKTQNTSLKINNYTKGELEIKAIPFGYENPISVGKITADGTIHLNWSELDLSKIEGSENYVTSIQQLTGGTFCKDSSATITNENVKPVLVETLFLYKYDQQVGAVIPSTQKNQEHNNKQLGSTIYWVYSDNETTAKANCSKKLAWEDVYSFNETTAYNLQLKNGWNMILNTLLEKEDWVDGTEKGSLPKSITKTSITEIPDTMHWYLKYWANDEFLEIEHQLVMLTPITKEVYENWVPKKLGNLKRTSYEIGKTIERMPTTNNVALIFENGAKVIDLTIVDCADSQEAASTFTLMQDMASRDWNDTTDTGYKSASKMDDTRVIVDYNEKDAKTLVTYNANNRFVVKAEANNITPEELWEHLKTLHLETLLKE